MTQTWLSLEIRLKPGALASPRELAFRLEAELLRCFRDAAEVPQALWTFVSARRLAAEVQLTGSGTLAERAERVSTKLHPLAAKLLLPVVLGHSRPAIASPVPASVAAYQARFGEGLLAFSTPSADNPVPLAAAGRLRAELGASGVETQMSRRREALLALLARQAHAFLPTLRPSDLEWCWWALEHPEVRHIPLSRTLTQHEWLELRERGLAAGYLTLGAPSLTPGLWVLSDAEQILGVDEALLAELARCNAAHEQESTGRETTAPKPEVVNLCWALGERLGLPFALRDLAVRATHLRLRLAALSSVRRYPALGQDLLASALDQDAAAAAALESERRAAVWARGEAYAVWRRSLELSSSEARAAEAPREALQAGALAQVTLGILQLLRISALGALPAGTRDPYAARGLALATAGALLDAGWRLATEELIRLGCAALRAELPAIDEACAARALGYLRHRLRALLGGAPDPSDAGFDGWRDVAVELAESTRWLDAARPLWPTSADT